MFKLIKQTYNREDILNDGHKFLVGNGKIGIRGLLSEYTKEQLVGFNLAGEYDQVLGKWMETINLPNPFYMRVWTDGESVGLPQSEIISHEQILDLKEATNTRITTFKTSNNELIIKHTYKANFYLKNLMEIQFEIKTLHETKIDIELGLDYDIWDINGPHLVNEVISIENSHIYYKAVSQQQRKPYSMVVSNDLNLEYDLKHENKKFVKRYHKQLKKDESIVFRQWATYEINQESHPISLDTLKDYDQKHQSILNQRWYDSDVILEGDEQAQFALRYSIYHLIILTPEDRRSVAARGISAQTYKGAVFWDSEIFLLPFYLNTNPRAARSILEYRIDTLQKAKEKANYYGYNGAFYAWESVLDGVDACSDFNVTDVFTNRPLKTYFKDKQIHISADVVYALMKYIKQTNDLSILDEGGYEVIEAVAEFFVSRVHYNLFKDYYECLDVIGPDEYHDRVNNNFFTNKMIEFVFNTALSYKNHMNQTLINQIKTVQLKLYIPKPNESGIIEQFDDYEKLLDIAPTELKNQMLDSREYLGGASGLAYPTKVIKQADVITALYLFRNEYSNDILKSNYQYYEPKTEHGSSLSASMYGLIASIIGDHPFAYDMFLKSATIDLHGKGKQYAGTIYIGGSHPAAQGGAYMCATSGFTGLNASDVIEVIPQLPKQITRIKYKLFHHGKQYLIDVTKVSKTIEVIK